MDWPTGSYVFDFVVDAGSTNNESNEANNTGSHTWVVP
jgi:subtilase family serine protease